MQEQKIFSVSEINLRIKTILDGDPMLNGVLIGGELSNYKIYPSGHHYFTLKDQDGVLRAVMFKSDASKLRFRPENGMKVIAGGRIAVFPRDGQYQLYCATLVTDGIGDLHVAYEQLKEKLYKEGLFDPGHKKLLPKYPERIAVITSSAGAAVRDIIRILRVRFPLAEVILLPVRVQGEEAPPEICGAIKYVNRHRVADVIIAGRGGGSIEDLWAFNDERVARTIFASEIPIISAVGHEPDYTISDFVADVRAATPSNAAELATPDISELLLRLDGAGTHMNKLMLGRLGLIRERLRGYAEKRVLQSPVNYIEDKRLLLDYTHKKLLSAAQGLINDRNKDYIRLATSLDALSPLKVLGRGYSIATKNDTGQPVLSPKDVTPGDKLQIRLKKGSILCTVDAAGKGTRKGKAT